MNFNTINHRVSDNFCYALNKEELIVNLKTDYDIEKVFIHYGDPFSDGIMGDSHGITTVREEILSNKRLKYHLWWTFTIKPEFKRCRYFFELINKDETYFYFENGFFTQEQIDSGELYLQFFTFPWMNPSDINIVPEWVNDTIWYQIMPDRFARGVLDQSDTDQQPWGKISKKTSYDKFYGGNLQGITDRLDYMQNLGITGLYMTPINHASTSHKYDTIDYMKIDPSFGDAKIMKHMVAEAHARNIRVMVDGVFNHCGWLFPYWKEVQEKGPDSDYYDWFMINKWPFEEGWVNAKKGNFYSFSFVDHMPKLNTNNPEVINYVLEICTKWIKEYDIDGIRLDVANEVSHTFCRELRKVTKSLKSDFFILGEIWHDSMPWLRGDEFDSVMNYPLSECISDFWTKETLTKEDFEYGINRCYTMYMQQTNNVLFNLLDSHDTIRLFTKLKNNFDKMIQQLAVLFTMPGTVCIYYGTEITIEGKNATNGRRPMPWKKVESGKYDDKLSVVKELIALRKSEAILKSHNYQFTHHITNDRVIEYIKLDDDNNRIQVIANCSDHSIVLKDEGSILFQNRYSGNNLDINGILIRKIPK